MSKELHVPLFDLVTCLSDATDLISPAIVNHHKQVAYISLCIGIQMGLTFEQRNNLAMAGALHDIGAISLKERIDALQFELENPHHHAEVGYGLLKGFSPFADIAEMIRYHHVPWKNGQGAFFLNRPVPLESHIIHLADRVAVSINGDKEIFGQVKEIVDKIARLQGTMFNPDIVEAFKVLADKEYFWLDAISDSVGRLTSGMISSQTTKLDLKGLMGLANLFRKIIDFRCQFTANHSLGVAATAETLAKLTGFSEQEQRMMWIAGCLHDLGKLAVPVEILTKPGKLTIDEFNIVKRHTYYTYRVLEPIADLETINTWAAYHHERLDGSGYPFHLSEFELSLGSRLMAVADIFTAISEDRPYRQGMDKATVFNVLDNMVAGSVLDGHIVNILKHNYDYINTQRIAAQSCSDEEYRKFISGLEENKAG